MKSFMLKMATWHLLSSDSYCPQCRVTRSVWRQWFNELLKGRMGKRERGSKVIKGYDSIGH